MQCTKIDLNNIPTSIREFFTAEEFAAISEYEKQHLSNLRQNFEALRCAGLPVHPPEFMLRNKSNEERQKLIDLPFLDSSDGSDSEWTPALEIVNKSRVNQKKKLFKPPKKVCRENGLKEEQIMTLHPKLKKQRKKQTYTTSEKEESHVYPFRNNRVTSYMSLAIAEDDDFLCCEECNQGYDGDCPVHGALSCVDDAEVSLMRPNNNDEYSKRTLPEGLEIKKSEIPNAGLGVFALKDFPARTRFGPYRGKKEINEDIAHKSGYSWQIIKDKKASHFVDARDPCESNWMRYVNCARHEEEQCVTAYQYKGEIYYRSHKHIIAGTEILVYYGDSYARDLDIQIQKFGRLGKKFPDKKNVEDCGKNGENDRTHSCTQCRLSFSTFQYLQKHMKYRHNNKYWEMKQTEMSADMLLEDKSFKCEVSDKKFALKSNLKRHKRIHTGEKPYKCDVCSVGFNQSSHLKTHKRIHTGEKPYKCDVCSVEFTTSGNLKAHKRIHTGEKPYKCDVCSVRCSQMGNLKKHKIIHIREKAYKCEVCSVEFAYNYQLKKHCKTHKEQ